MKCRRAKTLLIPFLEDRLSDDLTADITAHIQTCSACRREKELLSESWRLLDSYGTPMLREDFTSLVMRRVRSEEKETSRATRRSSPFTVRRLVPAFAVLLIVASLVFWERGATIIKSVMAPPRIHQNTVAVITDEEIIRDLDLYENAELLDNLYLLTDFDVIVKLDDSTLPQE